MADGWVEPAVATKASYEDHHGAPYGVLEHMQPLGEAPSAKVKGRVRSEAPRKSVLGRSSAAVGLDGQETPEGTPAPQPAPTTHANGSVHPPIVIDDEKDDDYAPKGKKKAQPVTKRTRKTGEGETRRKSSSTANSTSTSTPIPSTTASGKERVYDAPKLKRVVEAAKARAMTVGKPDLAAAVHEIWVESLKSKRLTDLLEAILTQTATDKQTEEFQNYVKRAKQRLKDAKTKGKRKQPAGTKALPLRSPSKFTPTPSADTETSALPSTEAAEPSRPKVSIKIKSPSKHSKARRRSRQTSKMSASPAKGRARSASESSALTDLTSGDDGGMEVDEQDDPVKRPAASSVKVNGVHGKDHAAERGSLAAPDRKLKRSSADADFEDDERERQIAAKKQKLSLTVNRDAPREESDVRKTTRSTPTAQSRTTRAKNNSALTPSISLGPAGIRGASARGSRAVSTDLDPDSPLSELSAPSSRLSTPHALKMPPKPPGKRAKTKTSPEKKQLTGYGGLSGAGGAGRESPIGDDDNEELSENNDFCSACGGSGFLLCCDGCDRSFHFSCLDPPLNEDASELNEPWYCFICVAKRPVTSEDKLDKPQRGLFAPLLNNLRKRNPSNYMLPAEVREFYESVQTDKNGSFVEAVHGKTRHGRKLPPRPRPLADKFHRNRAGYDELPDYYKIKDQKGNTVLCYCCGKSSMGMPSRPIIQCDYCGENWHLDCLDPPLANPPARSYDGKKLHDWMCPLHAEQELRHVDTRFLAPRRKLHLRRPRNAKVIETSLTRGFHNNGVVDILDEDSDDSDSEFYDAEHGLGSSGEPVVYKMPALGIKLDFIDKIKHTRVQQLRDERAHKRARIATAAPSALQQANFARRSFAEQKLALNLAQFSSANKDLDLGQDQVENLVGALIAEASPEVVDSVMADEAAEKVKTSASVIVPPSPPNSDQTDQLSAEQRKELEMLQELIRRKLEGSKT